MKQKSCGCVVFRKTPATVLYLFLIHQNNHLDFPKGHVEPGESEDETCVRELREETGITGSSAIPFRFETSYSFTFEGDHVDKEVVYFLREVTSDHVTVSEEHKGHKWLPYEQATQKLVFDNQRELLELANKTVLSNSRVKH